MKDLIEAYSVQEILTFLVLFAIAVKGFISFWDWGYARLKQIFDKEHNQKQEIYSIQNRFDEHVRGYEALQNTQNEALKLLTDKMNLLLESDKDSIKAYITDRYHRFCQDQKWIDDYTLECIEKRYKHYKDEGGNSFIYDLMEELRKLPRRPALDNKEE